MTAPSFSPGDKLQDPFGVVWCVHKPYRMRNGLIERMIQSPGRIAFMHEADAEGWAVVEKRTKPIQDLVGQRFQVGETWTKKAADTHYEVIAVGMSESSGMRVAVLQSGDRLVVRPWEDVNGWKRESGPDA